MILPPKPKGLRKSKTKRGKEMISTLALIGSVYMVNIVLVVVVAMGGTHLPPEAAWVAGFLTLLPLVWIRAMYVIAQDQNAREARFEIIEEDFNASDLDWEGGALEADSKYATERSE